MKTFSTLLKNKYFIKVFSIAVWVAVWYAAFRFTNNQLLMVSPLETFKNLIILASESDFWLTASFSLLRISLGYLAGVLLGTLFGIITGKSEFLSTLLSPLLTVIKTTPVASFILLALVWIKSGGVPVFISFLIVLPVIWANVSEGIKSVDEKLLEMARVFKLSKSKIIRSIYLPALKPSFLSGCITSVGLAWKAGISAEVLSQPDFAVGTKLYASKIYIETVDLFSWTVLVIILSLVLEKTVKALLRRLY